MRLLCLAKKCIINLVVIIENYRAKGNMFRLKQDAICKEMDTIFVGNSYAVMFQSYS